ncbi:MAG: hypothetical protein HQL24_10060 [Candidatus Omnitrophica bacterium]|nr:hypothetical protein [Candidatus Omnitrophota bacterium]
MQHIALNINIASRKALIFSFLAHLTIFSLFVFTLPIQKTPLKPNIFFLGAILKQNDVWPTETKRTLNGAPSTTERIIPADIVKSPNVSINDTGIPKPLFFSTAGTKRAIKSSFLEKQESPKTDKTDVLKELGIENDQEPYQPLILH